MVILLAALLVGVGVGAVGVPPDLILEAVARRVGLAASAPPTALDTIIWELRLPRVAAAGLVGACLATAGVLVQGLFRNPLADPYLLGMSSGAGLAATLALIIPSWIGADGSGTPVAWLAALGGVLAVGLVYGIARTGGQSSPVPLLLAGLAVSAVLGAMMQMLLLVGDAYLLRLARVWSWMAGGVQVSGWSGIAAAVPVALIGLALTARQAGSLDVLSLGDAPASHLGVAVERRRAEIIVVASLLTGAAVSLAGVVGFVGLIVPHAARFLVGPRHGHLLIAAALGGAAFVVGADLVARTAIAPGEVPLGVVTALVGGPWFLYLLRRSRRPTA